MQQKVVLLPKRICETMGGNLAHTVGRLAFRPGRPMLVEHMGGVYLEHSLSGTVLTAGYGPEYNIVYVGGEDFSLSNCTADGGSKISCIFVQRHSAYRHSLR